MTEFCYFYTLYYTFYSPFVQGEPGSAGIMGLTGIPGRGLPGQKVMITNNSMEPEVCSLMTSNEQCAFKTKIVVFLLLPDNFSESKPNVNTFWCRLFHFYNLSQTKFVPVKNRQSHTI